MIQLDTISFRREMIFLLRLEFRSLLFLLDLTMQQRRNLRGVG